MPNINELLREKNQLLEQLKSLLFGTIEIREKRWKTIHLCSLSPKWCINYKICWGIFRCSI